MGVDARKVEDEEVITQITERLHRLRGPRRNDFSPRNRDHSFFQKFIFIFAILPLLGGCGQAPEKASRVPAVESPSGVDQQVMSFSLAGYEKGGKKKWEVEGKSADIMAEVVNLTSVIAKAYGEEVNMTLVADKGVFNRVSNDVHFESNVVVTSADGSTLSTEALDWKNDAEKIYTDKPIKIVRAPAEDVSGAKPEPKQAGPKNGSKSPIDIGAPAAGPTTITCDGPMEINYGKNYAEFNTKVKVEDDRGQIFCDKAVAYYDPESHQVAKITATGNVKIVRGGSWTFSDEAVYMAQEQKIVLTGSPKVMIYPEEAKSLPSGQAGAKEGR